MQFVVSLVHILSSGLHRAVCISSIHNFAINGSHFIPIPVLQTLHYQHTLTIALCMNIAEQPWNTPKIIHSLIIPFNLALEWHHYHWIVHAFSYLVFVFDVKGGLRKVAPRLKAQRVPANPQLFDDMSMHQGAYPQPGCIEIVHLTFFVWFDS